MKADKIIYGDIVTMNDAMVENEEHLKSIQTKDREGTLNMHYEHSVVTMTGDDTDEVVARIREYEKKYSSENVHVGTIKVFLDGTNECRTSALLEPIVGTTDNYGEINVAPEKF